MSDTATAEREIRPLKSIDDNYPKYIVSTDIITSEIDGIQYINVVDWLFDEKTNENRGIGKGISKGITEESKGIILELITENPKVSVPEIAKTVNLSLSGVEKNIRQLKKEGKLSRTTNTKSGEWIVIE